MMYATIDSDLDTDLEADSSPSIHFLTVVQADTTSPSHLLLTLVHCRTGQQMLVDLLTDNARVDTVRALLDDHYYQDWGVLKVIDLDDPF